MNISVKTALQEGWRLTKDNLVFLFLYQFVLFFLFVTLTIAENYAKLPSLVFICSILLLVGKIGFTKSIVLMTENIKPRFDQFFKNWPKIITWVISGFLFGLLLAIGFILLIIPGFYVLARFSLFPFFIVDKNSGPLEALSLSSQATEGHRWKIFLLYLASIGLNILGLLFFGLGMLLTGPITYLALASVYKQLTTLEKLS